MADRTERERPGLAATLSSRVDALRRRSPLVDHAVRTFQHIGVVQGTMLAGAVTYFGYLSLFPVLAIGFGVLGFVSIDAPRARSTMVTVVESFFPGLIGRGPGVAIQIDDIARAAGAVSVIGLVGLLYSGLGWISAVRAGLQGVFEMPTTKRRGFAVGKAFDLVMLVVIGIVLMVSVALSSVVTSLTADILRLLQLDEVPGPWLSWLVAAVGVALGVAASTVLFFVIFTLLPAAGLPRGAVGQGAFVAALGFEVLKLLAGQLIGLASQSPATAVLGTSLVLLVIINYFSRVVMFGAAWAYTSPEARMWRDREEAARRRKWEMAERRRLRRSGDREARSPTDEPASSEPAAQRRVDRVSVAAGAALGATVTTLDAVVRRRRRTQRRTLRT
ncbi:MAG: YihY/virulence factor BrkB family protein [Nocardioidaceae bacterium]